MAILDYWYEFKAIPYSNEILIAIGALLLFFGVLKIVKSSLTMLFWVILSGIGITSIAHGLEKSPFDLASGKGGQVGEYLDAGKELSSDVLEVLCRKLDESQFGVPVQDNS